MSLIAGMAVLIGSSAGQLFLPVSSENSTIRHTESYGNATISEGGKDEGEKIGIWRGKHFPQLLHGITPYHPGVS
ncbi:hypothetical protein B0T14DRAFT_528898 [Immersiella caudata]|uniref:Uncharacterized protein n=1 Tax=Immersiella caudata TaxID=314043 RepID=A0AA39WFZ0_9PEZI|nr:hypothetical protein B0T14DRAFT_528898 [Immersiella caudata]